MKTPKEIEYKAIYLQKCIRRAESSWMPSKTEENKAELFKAAHDALMWALDYKPRYLL